MIFLGNTTDGFGRQIIESGFVSLLTSPERQLDLGLLFLDNLANVVDV